MTAQENRSPSSAVISPQWGVNRIDEASKMDVQHLRLFLCLGQKL
jgi:hypothetical protein